MSTTGLRKLFSLLLCLLAACNKGPGETAGEADANKTPSEVSSALPVAKFGQPHFVVSVLPLQFILREVCGEQAHVSTLLKAGANSHTYDPTPKDAQRVQEATAFFWIGEEFDGWAAEFSCKQSIEIVPLLPRDMVLEMAEHGDWSTAGDADDSHAGHSHGEPGHEKEHGSVDPHFACDPLLVKALLPELVEQLSELDPGGAATYAANALSFGEELQALNLEIEAQMKPLTGQAVILFHPSFNYFIQRYGLNYAGVIEPFPGKEPSPKYLQGIVQLVREKKAKAIFTETLLPAAPANVIAEAAGVPVFELDPACGNSERSYKDYSDWLRYNAEVFTQALQ